MSNHIRQFTGKKTAVVPTEKAHGGLGCSAHNCPLTGTMSHSTGGGGSFHCWAHDRIEEPSQWPYLTQGINENMWLFKVSDRVMTMPLYDLETVKNLEIENYLKSKDREDLCRGMKNDGQWSARCQTEPRTFWVMRLRNAAYKAAFEYVQANWSRAA